MFVLTVARLRKGPLFSGSLSYPQKLDISPDAGGEKLIAVELPLISTVPEPMYSPPLRLNPMPVRRFDAPYRLGSEEVGPVDVFLRTICNVVLSSRLKSASPQRTRGSISVPSSSL